MIITDAQGIAAMLQDNADHHAACNDYSECQCGSGDEHCMYCIQPLSAHVKRKPDDIPLDQAVEMIKAIAERQRAGLKAAGAVTVDESADNKIALV